MRKRMVEILTKSQSRVIKIVRVTQFALPNLSIYFNFLCAVPRDDVIESTRFLMRPRVNHSTMAATAISARMAVVARPSGQQRCR